MGKYEIRTLKATDVFKLTTILKGIGFKELRTLFTNKELLEQFKQNDTNKDTLAINLALDMVGIVIDNIDKCEEPIYRFLSSVSGIKENQIRNMDANEFIDMIYEVATNKEFIDFFKGALRFLK